MTSYISHTTVDCHNAYELSEWWKQVLGYVDIAGRPERARPRGVHDPSPDDRPPAAVHRGAGRASRSRTGSTSTCGRSDRHPRRGGRAAARPRRHRGRRPAQPLRARASAGWCSPTRRATSSASCAASRARRTRAADDRPHERAWLSRRRRRVLRRTGIRCSWRAPGRVTVASRLVRDGGEPDGDPRAAGGDAADPEPAPHVPPAARPACRRGTERRARSCGGPAASWAPSVTSRSCTASCSRPPRSESLPASVEARLERHREEAGARRP